MLEKDCTKHKNVYCFAVSQQANCIVAGTNNGALLINRKDFSETKRLTSEVPQQNCIRKLLVAEDGQSFVSWSNAHTIDCWDINSGECKTILDMAQYKLSQTDAPGELLGYIAENEVLITHSYRKETRLFSINLKSEKVSEDGLEWFQVVQYQNNLLVCRAPSFTSIKLYDYSNKQFLANSFDYFGLILQAQLSKDGSRLFCLTTHETLIIYDCYTQAVLSEIRSPVSSGLGCFNLSKDERYILFFDRYGKAALLEIETAHVLSFQIGQYESDQFVDELNFSILSLNTILNTLTKYPCPPVFCLSSLPGYAQTWPLMFFLSGKNQTMDEELNDEHSLTNS